MTQDQRVTVGGLGKPKSRRLWTAMWLLLLGPAALAGAGANEERRLDTPLKLLYRAQAPSETEAPSFMGRERALEALDRLRARPGRAKRGAAIEGPLSMRLPVLVKYAGDASRLEEAGFRVQGRVGSILTGSLEADRLVDLLNAPGVQFIQSSRRLRAQVDPLTGARSATLRAQSSLAALSSTGSGVLVAFIDTGVDVFHQDFQKDDGTTRIKYLLDLSDPGDVDNDGDLDGVGPYGGTLYTEADINAALTGGPMKQKDTTGHGSHGLSIAAGDDLALPGVAPGADLIVVKATREDGSLGFWSVDVVNALAFVDGKAAELARPYVVNLSLGTLFSSHDGRSLEEQALDALVGPGVPGKVAVIAAGNASDNRGTRFKHFRGSSLVGIPVDHTLEVPAYTPLAGRGNDRVLLDLWYEGRDRHRVSVAGPGCAPVTAEFGTFSDVQTPCGDVFIANMGTADPSNGDAESIVLIDDWSGTAPAAGTWTITVEAREVGESGAYHAWLAEESSLGNTQPYLTGSADNLFLVGKPGSAYNGITVGSFARHDAATRFRTSWTDVGGNSRTDASAVLEDISDFSSPGKTRDGRIKPELTAPGERVLGAVSGDAYPGVAPNSIYRFHPFAQVDALITENTANHAFGVLQGTSFSAPVVSGLAARILSTAPSLDAIQVRNILINSALADASTGAVPNDVWGFGKANLGVGDAPLPKDLRITTVDVPGGVLGEQYNLVLTASGGTLPYTWQVTSGALPPGLVLTASGFLTGRPTASGPFSFTVGVTDSSLPAQTDGRAYSLTVASVPPLQVVSHVLPVAKIGKPYEDTLEAKGGTPPYVWSLAAGDVPPGLTLFANGLIQGTPNTLGRFNFTVEVQDTTAAVARKSLRIKVSGEKGEDWDPLGKSTPTVNQIAVDPNDPNRVFVSTTNIDAVFETTNAGDSWRATSINNNLNTSAAQLRIGPSSTPWALAVQPFVFDRSLDRWIARPAAGGGSVASAIDFDAADTAYLKVFMTPALFLRSADQGSSWQTLASGAAAAPGGSLSVFRPNPLRMYSSGSATFATEDGGVTWSDVSNLSGGGVDIRVSQNNPFDVVKGTGSTVWRSADRGRNWTATVSPEVTGTICCLDRSPLEPSVVIAGTTQGLFKSSNGSQTWRQVSIKGTNPNVTAVAIDSSNPDSLWVGTGEGIFRSIDGGLAWSLKNNGLIRRTLSAVTLSRSSATDVLVIAAEGPYASRTSGNTWTLSAQGLGNLNLREALVSPADPNLFYVVNDSGLFRSDNRGVTWFEPNPSFDTGFQFVAVAADPFDANTLIASLSGTRGTYRSSDRGLTWALKDTDLPLLEPTDLAFARDLNGRVFQSFNARGVFRSDNKGDTWVQDGLDGTTVNDLEVAPSDSRYVYARAGTQLYYRNPSVTDWTLAVTQPSRPVLSLAVDAVSPLTAYAGVDHSGVAGETGGVYQTTDGGRSWARIPGILDTYDVVSVAAHPTTTGTVYAATLNAGVFRSTDGGQTWAELANYGTVADLTNVLVEDPSNPLLLFAGTEGYGVQVSADKGRTFAPRVSGLTSFNINAIAFDPDTPSTVYAGSDAGVFKSTNSGTTWAATDLTLEEVTDVVTDNEGTGRRIWASVLGQGVAFSSDAGANFTVYSNGLDSLELTSLEIENTGTGRRIWASAKGGSGLAYSDDLGQTWKPAAGNGLTDRNVNDVTIDTGAGRRIWASTDNGVFFSDDAGLSWRDLSLGLPSQVPVTSVAIDPNTSEVLVSLFSEGEGGVYRGGNTQGVWQPFNEGLGELRVRRLTSDKSHVVDATTRGTTFYAATAGDGAYASEIQTPAGTPVQITTSSLPDGLLKTAYTTTTLGAQGGRPPFVWSIALGSLPPGLSLDPSTGAIGGEPGQEGLFEFTVQAADQNARTDQKVLSIKVRHPDVPALSVNDVFVLEGNAGPTNATFTVSLSQASAQTVTVGYATADGTAFSTSDYGALGGSLSFTPGMTSQTATVAVNGDMLVEPDETLFLRLSNATNAVIADAEGLGTILDDDTPPTLSVSDVSVLEGDAGTVNAVFTVTLSRPVGVGVTVDSATADGTAIAGTDYASQSGTLTFLAGTTSQTVTVTVTGDTVVEPDETFFLNLTNPVNADIADGQGIVTILNDDGLPTLTIDDVAVTEGAPTALFTVKLSPASTQTVTVSFATVDGTATAPGDYQATTGTLSFPPGERVRTIPVPLANDTVDETVESFVVNLSGIVGAPLGDAQGQATVTDDDLRSLSIGRASVTEGNSGTVDAVLTVTLSSTATLPVTVDYATADGTATAGTDYVTQSGTLSFAPGTITRSVSVSVNGDAGHEPDEWLVVRLLNPSNALLASGSGGGETWHAVTVGVNAPPPRAHPAAAYDEANDRLILFGGEAVSGMVNDVNDVWVLIGAARSEQDATWQQLTPSGTPPAPRRSAQAAYDASTNRLIVHGGHIGIGSILAETWVLTHANGLGGTPEWIRLPDGPARTEHTAHYDPASNRLIILGGRTNYWGLADVDVWVLRDANGFGTPSWIQLTPNAGPAARYHHAGSYDPATNRLIVYGGALGSCTSVSDVWVLANANGLGGTPAWTSLAAGVGPPARVAHQAVFDRSMGSLIVYGGAATAYCGTPAFNDIWRLEDATGVGGAPRWSRIVPPGPDPVPPRYSYAFGFSQIAQRMIVATGYDGVSATNDAWVLQLPTGTITIQNDDPLIVDDDPVVNGVPYISDLSPTSALPGPGFDLVVRGANFVASSVVRWNGADRPTVFVSTRELRATISAADIAAAGVARVTVFNDLPGGGSSEPAALPVTGSSTAISFIRTDLPAGNQPLFAATGDFNADGKADLAATNLVSGTVSVWPGNGDGTFGARTDYPTGSSYAIAAADFNKDGRLDLAVTNYNHATVSILLGNGDGTFAPKTDFAAGASPVALTTGDFNADGRVDLAAALRTYTGGSSVVVLLGLGDGRFHVSGYYNWSQIYDPTAVVTGDFNGDGLLDLAVGAYGSVAILVGRGNGGFGDPWWFSNSGISDFSLAAADFDSTGTLDLAVPAYVYQGFVSFLSGAGTGTFGYQTSAEVGGDPVGVCAVELNADRRPDLAVANEGSDSVSVLSNNGGFSFGRTDFAVGDAPHSVVSADFNADGKLDLAVPNRLSNNVSILLNAPPPTLSISDAAVTEGNAGTISAVFTVTLAPPSIATVTVSYAPADGSATAPADYASTYGTLTFAAGTMTQTIGIGVVGDTTYEPDETFFVNLSGAVGATISGSQGVGTILNDDAGAPSLSFSASGYSVSEAGVRAVVTVKRAGSATGTVGVGYATSNGTATAGSDYTATSGTLTFGPGVSIQTFVVPIANDTISEGPETALLELSAPTGGAILGSPASAVLTIADNDAAGTLRFSTSAYSKSEGGGSASITVTRSGGAASGVTVDFATSDGTATAGSDYAGSSGTLSFGASEFTKTFAVSILEDSLGENNETVKLTLSNPTGRATLSAPSAAVLTILENESVLQFSAPTFKVTEGTAAATITVKRTGTLTGAVSVDYATSDGSGTTGSDYTQSSGTLSFASGVVARTFSVAITNDSVRENPETVLLALRNATGAGVALGPQNTAVLTIADNDSLLQFSAASYSVAESTALATITVKRTGSAAATVGVDFATSDGTAAAGSDYTTTTGTLTFGPGVVTRTFTVPITNDATAEPNEALNLSLSSPTGGAGLGSPNAAVLTIKDNDPLLRFSAATYSVSESSAVATITVTRSTSAGTVTVDFATSDGSAAAGSDYTTAVGTLTFLPGVLSRTFTVPIGNDALAEGNETVNLALLNPGGGAALGTPTTAVLTIVDNETLLRFSAATYNVSEGSPSATITVTRTGPTAPAVTVDFATTDGTAAAGSDYTTATGTLTFGPGVVTRTFTIPITNDAAAEPNETVNLTLASPTGGAGLGSPNTAVLTIVENEPRLQFSAASYAATEIGLKATVTVKRTGSTASAVGVTFATSDGTATAGSDYTGVTTTLSFPPGVVAKTVTIPIANDTIDDDSETLNLTLSNPTGGAGLGTPNAAVLTIADNDSGGAVAFGSASYSVSEPGGTATITVNRTGGTASGATVDYATSDGTAAALGDYTATSGTLTFAAGETTKTFTIDIIDDGLFEGNETVNLTLSSPGGGVTLGAQTTAALYVVDDEAP